MERTLVFVKPDGVSRGLVGEVISRFERRNLKIAALKVCKVSEVFAAEHYSEHKDKAFFNKLVEFTSGGTIVAMIIEGDDVLYTVRKLIGSTGDAQPGTIRGDYADTYPLMYNVVHASDSLERANIEINRFFTVEEQNMIFMWN